ncbi:hypothetical protein [Arcanobacterium hippocoleae]|uniref:Membrane protein n=1 Tax=Arcanobacterium hippocoleae TaxID=149017 RepID=A0ABU1T1R3_9ACTO|nr:hypothetical protein [Arcanobacterium hippocoleae]MDR6939324.1 putative membrane protein [Arcanobacterium hippocoleae]
MLSEKRVREGFLSGGLTSAGGALLFFITFLVRGIQGKSVLEWYIPTVLFTAVAAVLLVTWHAGRKDFKQAEKTFIATVIVGILSALVSVIGGFLFLG